jgi:GNAT superfamily N-acetyltransferase
MDRLPITYRRDAPLDPAAVARVFDSSGLRRPTGDPARIARMLANASLTLSAWDGDELVGIARSLTDFAWCCYLSDLAVARTHQGRGIGTELLRLTREAVGTGCSLVLVSAPEAVEWYPKVGLERLDRGFIAWRQG